MRSHGGSFSSFSRKVSVQCEDGDIEIEQEADDNEDDERRGGGRRMFGRNGVGRHGMEMGIDDVEGGDNMDHDEIYDEHNDNDHEEEDEDEEEGTQTQSEMYTRYTTRCYRAPPRMDDMDMDMH